VKNLNAMPLSLCAVCKGIVESPLVLREERTHHETIQGFLDAASSCYICRTITGSPQWKELKRRAKLCDEMPPAVWYLVPHPIEAMNDDTSLVWYKVTIDHAWDDYEISTPSDSLSGDMPDLYHETPAWEFRISSSRGTIYTSFKFLVLHTKLAQNLEQT
jgi:hypothetical protein